MRGLIHVIRTNALLAQYGVGDDAYAAIDPIESIVELEIAEQDELLAILSGEWTGDPFPDIDTALPRFGLKRVEAAIAAGADPLNHDGPDLGPETELVPA